MKRLTVIVFALITLGITAQESEQIIRPVLTGAPFLRVSPDARAGGSGDLGVATSPDAFSQYWNASKFVFAKNYSGVGLSYTPFLSNLTSDVFLLNGSYFTFLGSEERNTLGISLYYFNLGEINLTSIIGNQIIDNGIAKPNEFSFDVSYGLRLAETFSMAVTGRFIRSDLFNGISGTANADTKAASSIAVDIGGYFQSEPFDGIGDVDGRIRSGFQISNIGPKLDYSDSEDNQSFLPTNLRLGVGYDALLDDYNTVSFTAETTKLMVPTPQLVEGTDVNGSPIYAVPDDGVIEGMFKSFGDAPGGFKEELKEFTWSVAGEYNYNNQFAFRAGYFHESPQKGARQYITIGAGLQYQTFGIDVSYLITTSKINSALDNTLRFGLTWNFGGEKYY